MRTRLPPVTRNIHPFAADDIRATIPCSTPFNTETLIQAETLNESVAAKLPGDAGTSTKSSMARAFSASGDLHYNRKYDVSVEAMSTIKARMVAIPAPVEFLDEIRTYLLTWR